MLSGFFFIVYIFVPGTTVIITQAHLFYECRQLSVDFTFYIYYLCLYKLTIKKIMYYE